MPVEAWMHLSLHSLTEKLQLHVTVQHTVQFISRILIIIFIMLVLTSYAVVRAQPNLAAEQEDYSRLMVELPSVMV